MNISKQIYVYYAFISTILLSLSFAEQFSESTQEMLDHPITLMTRSIDIKTTLALSGIWEPIKLEVDPEIFPEDWSKILSTSISVRDVDKKYILSWLINFADAHATIRDDQSIYITTPKKLEINDTIFECYKETEGDWVGKLTKKLEMRSPEVRLNGCSVMEYIDLQANLLGFSFLIDPEVLCDKELRTNKISIQVNSDKSCGEELKFVLNQSGLIFKLQGGVLFITKQQALSSTQPSEATVD